MTAGEALPVSTWTGLLVEGLLGQKVPQILGEIVGRHVPFRCSF